MRTTGKYFFCALFVFFALATVTLGTAVADRPRVEKIEAVIKDSDSCSSVGGKFDAIYHNRKIDVVFYFKSNEDKEIEIYKGDKEWKEGLEEVLCPRKGEKKIALSGKKVTLEGEWRDLDKFIAYEIYLPEEKPEKKKEKLKL